jgi:hypothetical protein
LQPIIVHGLQECAAAVRACTFCHAAFARALLPLHQSSLCTHRRVECGWCAGGRGAAQNAALLRTVQ